MFWVSVSVLGFGFEFRFWVSVLSFGFEFRFWVSVLSLGFGFRFCVEVEGLGFGVSFRGLSYVTRTFRWCNCVVLVTWPILLIRFSWWQNNSSSDLPLVPNRHLLIKLWQCPQAVSILSHEAKALLELFCLQPIVFDCRENVGKVFALPSLFPYIWCRSERKQSLRSTFLISLHLVQIRNVGKVFALPSLFLYI